MGAFLISNDTMGENNHKNFSKNFNWKKLLPPPLIGLIVALIWLILNLPLPPLINNTFTMVGNLVTPLALIYIGIILSDAGLKSVRIDRDTILGLIARFIIAPLIMIIVIKLFVVTGSNISTLESNTLIVQSAVPGLAVLPLLVGEAKGDAEYATNLVTTSTILFIIVIPILMEIIHFI